MDLGFLRTDAVDALAQAGGNVEVAASFLFHQQQELRLSLHEEEEQAEEKDKSRANGSKTS